MATPTLDRATIVEFIADIFERRGAESYLGEPVTMSEHMLQGGPMSAVEVAEFRRNPFHAEAVRVRLWDEAGKVPAMQTPPFRYFMPLLQRVVDGG